MRRQLSPDMDVTDEVERVSARWERTFSSPEELLGVLRCEYLEFEETVKTHLPSYSELVQVASVAIRGLRYLSQDEEHKPRCEVELAHYLQRQRERDGV